jgi:3-oxoacyl-[acyl-carrier protein] reductase
MDLNLQGKSAFVCGSTQGIGYATAQELAELGANVTFCARNEAKLKEVVAEFSTMYSNGTFEYVVADFGFPDQLEKALVEHLANHKSPYNILVNNTGGPAGGPAHSAGIDEYRQAFNAHLICNQILVQQLLPGMKEAGYGRIVNVISTSVKQPLNNLGVSNTVRGAVANWSKTLANELGQFNITVNNVLPGATETARLSSILENKSAKLGVSIDEAVAQMTAAVPMKRFAKPGEVAAAIAFLCSPAAGYINGINVPVDGGRTGSL